MTTMIMMMILAIMEIREGGYPYRVVRIGSDIDDLSSR